MNIILEKRESCTIRMKKMKIEPSINPDSSSTINVEDSLILIGDLEQIDKFRREVCNDSRPLAERTRNSETLLL